jgi:hypothetical protein
MHCYFLNNRHLRTKLRLKFQVVTENSHDFKINLDLQSDYWSKTLNISVECLAEINEMKQALNLGTLLGNPSPKQ